MQIAATQLSSMLLQPDMVHQLAASPEKYAKVVDMLCRLSTQIQLLQKDRDEAVRKSQHHGCAEHMKREDERSIETLRATYSCAKLGEGPRDPDIPHRNELPPREQVHYPPVQPPVPSFTEFLHDLRSPAALKPAAPAAAALPQARAASLGSSQKQSKP